MWMGSTTGSSAIPSTPAGSLTGSPTSSTPMAVGSTPPVLPPPQAGSYLGSTTPVPTGSNLGSLEQPKPRSAESHKRKRRKARQAATSATPAQPSTSTGSEKEAVGQTLGNPSNAPKPRLDSRRLCPREERLLSLQSRGQEPPGCSTPDDTLPETKRPCPDTKQMGQGAAGPRSYTQRVSENRALQLVVTREGQTNMAFTEEQLQSSSRDWLLRELINIRPWEGINLISVDPDRFRNALLSYNINYVDKACVKLRYIKIG
ncbi:hypothetical protein JTB14_004514 [Gonioctena quinquepunctata]|nr:hypothetical protein JTB14_004514 [Gonioctena quinquepunctata]